MTDATQEAEKKRKQLGREGEGASVAFLESRGYRVLTQNFHCRAGELDIVAEKDGVLCFVEVRTRSSAVWGDPSHTVSGPKQRRVVKAALQYLRLARLPPMMVRFDVISIVGRGKDARLEHIPNAFDAGM